MWSQLTLDEAAGGGTKLLVLLGEGRCGLAHVGGSPVTDVLARSG
jgi:hypothetical protein